MYKKNIETREDIELLVNQFYTKVRQDITLGHIFNDTIEDWDQHLPIMYSFWESMLLDKTSYKRNPMIKHIALDKSFKLLANHFDRWLELWTATVSELFKGDKADQAISKASMMAKLMLYKVEESRKAGFIQ